MFEIDFSKAGNSSIHLYKDPPSIRTIAQVKDISSINEIKDARQYDTSSRARTIQLNQIAVLQNNNGFFAALKVLTIKDDTRGDQNDEVTFEYKIQTNGSPDFTSL
jgi:hypothetical protein